jgi:hypothetical protein
MASWISRLTAYLVAAGMALISAAHDGAHAQALPADARIEFNIPAQPLAKALIAYGAVTGLEIFYNASLAGGLTSDRVVGVMTPEAGLKALLRGTSYTARSTGPGTFTITQAPRDEVSSSMKAVARRQLEPYFAELQRGISDALCRYAGSPAAQNELVYRFWMSRSGVVERIDVLADNGERADDQRFAAPIRGLALAAPPTGLSQPINMVIFPPAPGSSACRDRHAGRRAGFVTP